MKRTKEVIFGIHWEMYGQQTFTVPDDIDTNDQEAVLAYLQEHIDEIPLPKGDYVLASAAIDPEGPIGTVLKPSKLDLVLRKAKKMGAKVEFIQDIIDDDHLNCLWYGGRILEVFYKGYTFILGAYGDVNAVLFSRLTGGEVCRVKDKANGGGFNEMRKTTALTNDIDLEELQRGESREFELVFENNNWLEILVDAPDGTQHDTGWVTNDDDIPSAFEELLDNMDEFIKDTEA